MNDEEFLAQFARLNSEEGSTAPVTLNAQGLASRDLSLCTLARVITERGMLESNFPATMRRAWAADPETEFVNVARNMYLVQFTCEEELHRTMNRGIWSYRGDIVALKRITDPAELSTPSVTEMEVWTQFHKIPAHAVTNEGIRALAEEIGTPLTETEEAYTMGVRYCWVKILIKIDKPLKELVSFLHPVFGTLTVYTSYERITKLCGFCANINHESGSCPKKTRFDRLRRDPRFRDRPEIQRSKGPRAAPWLTDPSLIPRQTQEPQQHPNPQPLGPTRGLNSPTQHHNTQPEIQTETIFQAQTGTAQPLPRQRSFTTRSPVTNHDNQAFGLLPFPTFIRPDLNTQPINLVQSLVHRLEIAQDDRSGQKGRGCAKHQQ